MKHIYGHCIDCNNRNCLAISPAASLPAKRWCLPLKIEFRKDDQVSGASLDCSAGGRGPALIVVWAAKCYNTSASPPGHGGATGHRTTLGNRGGRGNCCGHRVLHPLYTATTRYFPFRMVCLGYLVACYSLFIGRVRT